MKRHDLDRIVWRTTELLAIALVLAFAVPVHSQPLRPSSRNPKPTVGKPKPGTTSSRKPSNKKDGQDLVEEGLYSCHRGKVRRVSVSFKPEVELKDLITWAMGFTCKNFIYNSKISSRIKVTIIAPKTMTRHQAWRVFLTALQSMNLTIVPKGNVLRILESNQAKSSSIPLYRRGGPGGKEQLVRAVIRPRHMPPEDVATALKLLASKEGKVDAVRKAGVLLVTDWGSHIAKMKYLMAEIDQPLSGERLYMIKVQNADVTELASKLQEVLGVRDRTSSRPSSSRSSSRSSRNSRSSRSSSNRSSSTSRQESEVASAIPSRIMADERTNSLIVMATEAGYLRVLALVKRLDVAVDVEGAGRIHVYYLENADAEELAGTLGSVISGVAQPSSSRSRSSRSSRTRRSTSSSSSSAGSAAFEGQVRVTHDKPSNALVIVASVKDFLALREVIRKLDAPRRQVFIEASIFELNISSARDLGTSFHLGDEVRDGIVVGGVQHGDLSSLNPASLATGSGLLGGLIGPLLDNAEEILGVGTSIPSYSVLLQALASNDNVNVLSSPHILTTDNEEAEISVGQNIPFQSTVAGLGSGAGQTAPGGFGFPIGTSVSRQDVALTLKITPHVNASDMVRLELDQEISDVANENFQGLGPSWSKRTVKTTVVVRDQQTIVIGGLMQEREALTVSKVPLLGDIPLLGYLFKFTRKSKAKTNLLIMLTPYVIKDQLDIEQIVQEKVRERAEFVRAFTSLSKTEMRQDVDYRRKRGLVAEINHVVGEVEREAQILRDLDRKLEEFPDGPIEYTAKPKEPVTDAKAESESKSESSDKEGTAKPTESEPPDKKSSETESDKTELEYRVKRGDTLRKIARRFETTIPLLVERNRIADPSRLKIGQVLVIPVNRRIE